MTVDLLDVAYHLAQVPTVYGWGLLTGGLCALSWLAGSAR